MQLELESGTVIPNATPQDILQSIGVEEFAILSVSPETYLQCATRPESPGEYVLEFQDGSLARHYEAVDRPITRDRVIDVFLKYLRDDPSWAADLRWQKMNL